MEAYRYLKDGEILKEGDEVNLSFPWNSKPEWIKTTIVGSLVPSILSLGVRYRRKI